MRDPDDDDADTDLDQPDLGDPVGGWQERLSPAVVPNGWVGVVRDDDGDI